MYGIELEKAHEAYHGVPLVKLGQGECERSYYDVGRDGVTGVFLDGLGWLGRHCRRFVRAVRYGFGMFCWAMLQD